LAKGLGMELVGRVPRFDSQIKGVGEVSKTHEKFQASKCRFLELGAPGNVPRGGGNHQEWKRGGAEWGLEDLLT